MSVYLVSSYSLNAPVAAKIFLSSPGAGDPASQIFQRLSDMWRHTVPPSIEAKRVSHASLREMLYNASADLKILFSRVSMHFPEAWKKSIFQKIDRLYMLDDWSDDDVTITASSFHTFIRTMLFVGPAEKMSLGLSNHGNLLAGWIQNRDSLWLEFAPNDEIRWSIVRHLGASVESAVGTTALSRLRIVLQPYNFESWYSIAS